MNKYVFSLLFLLLAGCFGGGTRRSFILEAKNSCPVDIQQSRVENFSFVSISSPLYLDTTKINIRKTNFEIGSFQESFWGEIPATAIKRILRNDLLCVASSQNIGSVPNITLELRKLEVDTTGEKPYARYEVQVSKRKNSEFSEKIFSFEKELASGEISEVMSVFNEMISNGSKEIASWSLS